MSPSGCLNSPWSVHSFGQAVSFVFRLSVSSLDSVSIHDDFYLQDCTFHPTERLVAAGLITGQVRVSEYNRDAAHRKCQKKLHSESCRAVRFSTSGDALLTGSADTSFVILDTGTSKVQRTQKDAHPCGLSRIAELAEQSFASGQT